MPTREKTAPQPEIKPAAPLRYPQRGRATTVKPVPYGQPGYNPDQGLPSDAPRIKVAPSTGFDPGTMFGPKDLAALAHERRKNLGSVADTARRLIGTAADLTGVPQAIHSVGPHGSIGKAIKAIPQVYVPGVKLGALVGTGKLARDAKVALDAFHGYPEEKTAANLRSKLNPRNAARGLPQNPRVRQSGQHILGPITPKAWVKRVVETMPTKGERTKWAQWYKEVKPLFDKTFGVDSEKMLRGFAVSQANASPTSGLEAVLRVVHKIGNGEPIKPNEISAVVKSIEAAVKGEHVEKGVAAKLSDFIDSLHGYSTRTWMGHAPEGGAPAAIDVHALRDLGYVDPKLVARLEKRGLELGRDFMVDSPGVAKGPMYERAAEQYQRITDHLNKVGFDGRKNWTPAEVQALGWAAIQKFHGAEPEDLAMAIERNTKTIVNPTASAPELETAVRAVSGTPTRSGDGWIQGVMSKEQAAAVAQHFAESHGETRVLWLSNKSQARTPLLRVNGQVPGAALHELQAAGFTHVYEMNGEDVIRADGPVDQKAVAGIIDKYKLDVTFNGKVQEDVRYGSGAAGSRAMEAHRGTGAGEARLLASQRGRNLEGLPGAVRVAGREDKLAFGASAPIQRVAQQYMREAKLPYLPPFEYAKVDPERAARIADEYARMAHDPSNPAVRASYDAFIHETMDQYEALQRAGYRFEFYPRGRDPYPNGPREAILDLIRNKHMYVFPTDEGFGTINEISDHPLLAVAPGVRWNGQPVTYNDIFRAVHDVFGHAKEGVGFRADGEENAWRSHVAMYSPEARPAMTAETRGQNSWVNFGPHGEANRTASQADTVYADQKAGLLPDWVMHEGAGTPEPSQPSLFGRLADESGQVTPGDFLRGPHEPRLLQHNELVQQVPSARSQITKAAERLVDHASRALERLPNVHDFPGVRILTASERVAKYAGREQRIESSRRQAQAIDDLHVISHIKEGSPDDVANFWYAQLPASHRNAEGLQLIHDKQAQELEYITSGQALEDLTKRESAVKAAMSEAETNGEALRHLRDLEEIKLLKTDLPQRVDDITASLGELEKLIANAPAANEAAIKAADNLSRERERILTESGRLNEDRAGERRGLVSRFVGLEPTGEETYIGHRLPKPESFRGSTMPSGGTGRVKSPQGVGSKNHLVLARTGRLRASLRVAAEDWQSAQVFEQANIAREDLAKLGTKFNGYVPEGHVLINPKGRTVPAHWKTDELAQFADDYHDNEVTRERAKEILDGFIATDRQGFEQMKQDALEQGVSWDELRVVPKRLVDRYYAQFRPSRARGGALKAYDSAIDAVSTSIVFARLGYIPKNFAQNLIMAVPHQGAFLLVNAVRAAQAMKEPQLRHLIHAEIGFTGPSGALSQEMFLHKATGKVTGAVSKLADDPARIAAFLHEAAAEGVISRVKPLLDEKDHAALLDLLTNPAKRSLLNDIRSRSVEAMADFSRLTPDQARIARRFLIIPGWLMAGSRYPFHFAATHPIRSALLAYIALGEPGAPDQLQFNQNISHYFKGSSYKQGIQIGDKRLRTSSLSPVGTPWDLGLALKGTIEGKKGEFDTQTPTVFDEVAPLVSSAVSIAQGEGVKKGLEKLAPNQSFVEGMLHPHPSGTYPDDASRLGRLEREVGVVPIHVNDVNTLKDQEKAKKWVADTEAAIGQKLPHEVIVARNTKVTYVAKVKALEQKENTNKLTDAQRAEIKLEVLVQTHPIYAQYEAELRRAIKLDATKTNTWIEDKLEWPVLDRLSAVAKKMEKAHAAG